MNLRKYFLFFLGAWPWALQNVFDFKVLLALWFLQPLMVLVVGWLGDWATGWLKSTVATDNNKIRTNTQDPAQAGLAGTREDKTA